MNRIVVLLGTFKLLSIILSCLVCWMDGINSFAATFRVFFVQLTMRLLRFTKIRAFLSGPCFPSLFKTICQFFSHRRISPGVSSSEWPSKASASYSLIFRQIRAMLGVLAPSFKISLALTILWKFGTSFLFQVSDHHFLAWCSLAIHLCETYRECTEMAML